MVAQQEWGAAPKCEGFLPLPEGEGGPAGAGEGEILAKSFAFKKALGLGLPD
jgi:hypothetical protein